MKLYAIDPAKIDDWWPAVVSFIQRATENSLYDNPRSVYESLKAQRSYLWLIIGDGEIKAVLATQLVIHPKAKTCSIWFVVGSDSDEWIHLISEIEAYAKREGCSHVINNARKGLARKLKPYGYGYSHVILEKAI